MDVLVDVEQWPALRAVMWDDHRKQISPEEAWSYYDSRWRWVELHGVEMNEREFQQKLAAVFGSYFDADWATDREVYWADVDVSVNGFLCFTRWLEKNARAWQLTPVDGEHSWARVWVPTKQELFLFEVRWSEYVRRSSQQFS